MDSATVYYLTQNLSDVPVDRNWLSAHERARVAGFRFAKRRDDWILGRWTAKQAIHSFLIRTGRHAPEFSQIEIRSAADGAPEPCLPDGTAPVALALSHSGGQGFCALTDPGTALGCDLEVVLLRDTAFLHDYFCEQEKTLVLSTPADRQSLMATLIWSAKESALKCLREGLRRDTRSVLVSLRESGAPGWKPMTVACLESSRSFFGWWHSSGTEVRTIAADVPLAGPIQLAGKTEGSLCARTSKRIERAPGS